ncbi:MAG: hypothetical protein ACR2JB_04900 [Bryobacteraceae bacterium]
MGEIERESYTSPANWFKFARRVLRKLVAAALAAIAVAITAYTISSPLPGTDKDVTEYWAAGRLLLKHANPYDEKSAFRLERQAGAPITRAQVMFNPPTALFFALPFGMLSAHWAIVLWALLIIGCIVLSIRILWVLLGRRQDRSHLLGYVFAPILRAYPSARSYRLNSSE